MKAVIPAAGYASRLRPLTNDCHKSMLPLRGTTMMEMILRNLRIAGIRHIVVITGFKAAEMREYISSKAHGMIMEFIHNPDFETTGNSYSLSLASPAVSGDSFLLLDSDVVFEPEAVLRVAFSEYPNSIALRRSDNLSEEEMKIYTGEDDSIISISKEGNPEEAVGESLGIEKFSPETGIRLFETLIRRNHEGEGKTEFYEASFTELINTGEVFRITDVSDLRVMEVDYPEDIEKAENELVPYILRAQKEIAQ